MPLFTKGGGDSINVFGHKVPIALIGGVAALLGVILVIRARQSGSNVASVGTAPNALSSIDPFASTSPDMSAQLNNIEQELANLQQNGINSATSSSSSTSSSSVVNAGPPTCPPGFHAQQVNLGIASFPGMPRPTGWMCVPDSPTSLVPTVVSGTGWTGGLVMPSQLVPSQLVSHSPQLESVHAV